MNILAIYDDPNCFDRYSVYYNSVDKVKDGKKFYWVLGMSANPFHPQGFLQHTCGQLGRHNGKRIQLKDLPTDCRKEVLRELEILNA